MYLIPCIEQAVAELFIHILVIGRCYIILIVYINVENKVISETFGVMSIPRFILINPDGTICNAEAFRPSDKEFKEKLDAALQ